MSPNDVMEAFQSTPPVRGETGFNPIVGMRSLISIHSPRAGGDGACCAGKSRPS